VVETCDVAIRTGGAGGVMEVLANPVANVFILLFICKPLFMVGVRTGVDENT
jgi:hypothetical protein